MRLNQFSVSVHICVLFMKPCLLLRWPVTGGNRALFDFAVTDPIVQPPDGPSSASAWAESLALLPKGGLFPPARAAALGTADLSSPTYSSPSISDRSAARAVIGIPPQAFVMAAHNQHFKLTPGLLDCWAGLLKRISSSEAPGGGSSPPTVATVLWLLEHPAEGLTAVQDELAARGLTAGASVASAGAGVVVLASPFEGDRSRHLRRLSLCADVFLDTAGMYSGGATVADALAAGVPVVSLDPRAALNDATSVGAVLSASARAFASNEDEETVRRVWSVPSGASPVARLAASLVAGEARGAYRPVTSTLDAFLAPAAGGTRVSMAMLVAGLKDYEDAVVSLARASRRAPHPEGSADAARSGSGKSKSKLEEWAGSFTASLFAMAEATATGGAPHRSRGRAGSRREDPHSQWQLFSGTGTNTI